LGGGCGKAGCVRLRGMWLCFFTLVEVVLIAFEIVLRRLVVSLSWKKFCRLDLGLGLHYRKPFKVLGYIYEKSDI